MPRFDEKNTLAILEASKNDGGFEYYVCDYPSIQPLKGHLKRSGYSKIRTCMTVYGKTHSREIQNGLKRPISICEILKETITKSIQEQTELQKESLSDEGNNS